MKKIFFSFALFLATLTLAQDYYDTYPTEYNGYEYYDSSYSYPDEYYYNYPTDYYPDAYYHGYYNDYRNAVVSVNWNQFFVQYHLTPIQINQIIILNKRFASFNVWNSYYRWNPNRWYYDRFYALQRILGPQVFVVYQNVYFRGASPFVYYRNRCVNFYAHRYPVRPVYRNVNINVYKVNPTYFKESFRTAGRNNNMISPSRNGGMANPSVRTAKTTTGVRTENSAAARQSNYDDNRNQGEIRSRRPSQASPEVRNQNNSMRQNSNYVRRSQNSDNQRGAVSRPETNTRNSGARFTSRSN